MDLKRPAGGDSRLRTLAAALAAAVALLAPGCSGSDDTRCLSLTSATPAAGASVSLSENDESSCSVLVVDMDIANVDEVFSVNFVMTYDPDVVEFESFDTSDTVLDDDGVQVVSVASDPGGAGTITGSVARLEPSGITVGSGKVGSLVFRIEGLDELSRLRFVAPTPDPTPRSVVTVVTGGGPTTDDTVTFTGGTVTVR